MCGVVESAIKAPQRVADAESLVAAVLGDPVLATVLAAAKCVRDDLEDIYITLVRHGAGTYAAVALSSPVTLAYLARAHKHGPTDWSNVADHIVSRMGRL